jgi:hypothetical protein
MLGCERTPSVNARWISAPVMSPECRTRRLLWPPSRPRSKSPSSPRSKLTPHSASRRTAAGPSLDAELDDVGLAEAGAGDERVVDVLSKGVFRAEHARQAALGVARVGLEDLALGDERAPADGGRLRAQTRDRRCRCRARGRRHRDHGVPVIEASMPRAWPSSARKKSRKYNTALTMLKSDRSAEHPGADDVEVDGHRVEPEEPDGVG